MSTQCFAGKTVIITGASSGIGAGTAVAFAKRGANLILGGRNEAQLNDVKKKCLEAGLKENQVVLVIGDVVDENVTHRMVDSALEKFGKLDVLVNNAGAFTATPVPDMKMEDFDRMHNVNLRSVVCLSMKALPHLVKSKGNIVSVSSIGSARPVSASVAYCMAKAGVDMFTQCLAFEMAPQGVRVNSVNPGMVFTNLARDANPETYKSDTMMKGMMDIHRLGRQGEVNEIADAIMFLASDHATFITGQMLKVCGGASIPGVAL